MKFADLTFAHRGCCAAHSAAVAQHDNGARTDITDNGNGTYTVCTWVGQTLQIGAQVLLDQAAVEARLVSDAALSV